MKWSFRFKHGSSTPFETIKPGTAELGSARLLSTASLAVPHGSSTTGGGQNTDSQSMDYPHGLPKWTTLKWTTPKNTISDYILTLHDLRGL